MSFEEIAVFLKSHTKNLYEQERLQCFFNLISQGIKVKKPEDIVRFGWEKKIKENKKPTKEQIEKRAKKAEEWLNKKQA
jgi:hypothetical protein